MVDFILEQACQKTLPLHRFISPEDSENTKILLVRLADRIKEQTIKLSDIIHKDIVERAPKKHC